MWLNEAKTLMVNRNKDTWQSIVYNSVGDYLGNVVAQIIEPSEYLVRYFLVYNPSQKRRYLIPTDIVTSIDETIRCTAASNLIARLPDYDQTLERKDELEIFHILATTPYWES